MRVLISNPILYTSEKSKVNRAVSIKDTMIYDLCMAFHLAGHKVTLIAAEDFKPNTIEVYPFEVNFFKTRFKRICRPNCLPWLSGLNKYIYNNKNNFDLVISSEVFSISSLIYSLMVKDKLIVWHELAKHNNILKKIPSYIWHNLIARTCFHNTLIVPRSIEARDFISKYCNVVCEIPVDHGVNLDLFTAKENKKNSFIVCSQLIERKQIDGIIKSFSKYLQKVDSNSILNIAGSGEEEIFLKNLVEDLHIKHRVKFLGKLDHETMLPYLANAKALLVNTCKDNNLLSIVEALAVCTPVVTTSVPYNSSYIRANKLGIVKDGWGWSELAEISKNNTDYIKNCKQYRKTLSTHYRVNQFLEIYRYRLKGGEENV